MFEDSIIWLDDDIQHPTKFHILFDKGSKEHGIILRLLQPLRTYIKDHRYNAIRIGINKERDTLFLFFNPENVGIQLIRPDGTVKKDITVTSVIGKIDVKIPYKTRLPIFLDHNNLFRCDLKNYQI